MDYTKPYNEIKNYVKNNNNNTLNELKPYAINLKNSAETLSAIIQYKDDTISRLQQDLGIQPDNTNESNSIQHITDLVTYINSNPNTQIKSADGKIADALKDYERELEINSMRDEKINELNTTIRQRLSDNTNMLMMNEKSTSNAGAAGVIAIAPLLSKYLLIAIILILVLIVVYYIVDYLLAPKNETHMYNIGYSRERPRQHYPRDYLNVEELAEFYRKPPNLGY